MTREQDEIQSRIQERTARIDVTEQLTRLLEALTYLAFTTMAMFAVVALVLLRFLPWNKLF